jgi:hypothetical protein
MISANIRLPFLTQVATGCEPERGSVKHHLVLFLSVDATNQLVRMLRVGAAKHGAVSKPTERGVAARRVAERGGYVVLVGNVTTTTEVRERERWK